VLQPRSASAVLVAVPRPEWIRSTVNHTSESSTVMVHGDVNGVARRMHVENGYVHGHRRHRGANQGRCGYAESYDSRNDKSSPDAHDSSMQVSPGQRPGSRTTRRIAPRAGYLPELVIYAINLKEKFYDDIAALPASTISLDVSSICVMKGQPALAVQPLRQLAWWPVENANTICIIR